MGFSLQYTLREVNKADAGEREKLKFKQRQTTIRFITLGIAFYFHTFHSFAFFLFHLTRFRARVHDLSSRTRMMDDAYFVTTIFKRLTTLYGVIS